MLKAVGTNHILRGIQVADYLGYSLSTVYRRINDGLLPTPIRYGRKSVAWHMQELGAVVTAQDCGYTDPELKDLVREIIEKRNYFKEEEK
ncbi:AlpA family transcriptional regulator [Photobacterium sp. TLY01]|uniref:helix-turn-helix transcriptional regulator n=1 Tax=Photobacterium sp. TLY01 TaxID=2907534 RepID=UPI001F389F84|nr:AlpA family phage regulatory protein [Photobacterium sp. TLY01]UIP27773.1 AlpA family phage regulatory protein [Photobacterium sp. TLY01]